MPGRRRSRRGHPNEKPLPPRSRRSGVRVGGVAPCTPADERAQAVSRSSSLMNSVATTLITAVATR